MAMDGHQQKTKINHVYLFTTAINYSTIHTYRNDAAKTEGKKMTYSEKIASTINGELTAPVARRNKQARRGQKDQTIPNEKYVLKLIKYWKRAAAK